MKQTIYYRVLPYHFGKIETRRIAAIDAAYFVSDGSSPPFLAGERYIQARPDVDCLVQPSMKIIRGLKHKVDSPSLVPEGDVVLDFLSSIEGGHDRLLISWGGYEIDDIIVRFAAYRNLIHPYDWHAKNTGVKRRDIYVALLAEAVYLGDRLGLLSAPDRHEALKRAMEALKIDGLDPYKASTIREVVRAAIASAPPGAKAMIDRLFSDGYELPIGRTVAIFSDGVWTVGHVYTSDGGRVRVVTLRHATSHSDEVEFKVKTLPKSYPFWMSESDLVRFGANVTAFKSMASIFTDRWAQVVQAYTNFENLLRSGGSRQDQDVERRLYDVGVYNAKYDHVWARPSSASSAFSEERLSALAERTDEVGVLARRLIWRRRYVTEGCIDEAFRRDAQQRLKDSNAAGYTIAHYYAENLSDEIMYDDIGRSILMHNMRVGELFELSKDEGKEQSDISYLDRL